ncbi:MAG: hypothetical protein DRQ43_04760 [Gammaproteobacteria bacterium]|nr:MAG: hypothetical protein DRQ43_04760 [Gammaproteobacteria bacterium]
MITGLFNYKFRSIYALIIYLFRYYYFVNVPKSVIGRNPLAKNNLRDFKAFVDAYSDEIVKKWIDYFVLHKQISCENINKRIK